jgi:hypothetical protein
MADTNNKANDVTIWNDAYDKNVSVVTDGSIERLAVTATTTESGDAPSVIQTGNAFFLTAGAVITVAAGANYDVMIVTGVDKEIHLKDISVNVLKNAASGNTQFRLFEAITTSANGTASSIFNNNRIKQGVVLPDFTAFTNPTVTATGTLLINYLTHNDWETYVAPSYTNKWEIILKTNTKYLLRFFNNTNQANDFTYLYWLFQDDL